MFAVLIAALAHHLEEQHAPLRRICHVFHCGGERAEQGREFARRLWLLTGQHVKPSSLRDLSFSSLRDLSCGTKNQEKADAATDEMRIILSQLTQEIYSQKCVWGLTYITQYDRCENSPKSAANANRKLVYN
jgi:hypothetical protein